jgi:hypothetical protein
MSQRRLDDEVAEDEDAYVGQVTSGVRIRGLDVHVKAR